MNRRGGYDSGDEVLTELPRVPAGPGPGGSGSGQLSAQNPVMHYRTRPGETCICGVINPIWATSVEADVTCSRCLQWVRRPERANREGDSQPLPTVNDSPDVQSAVIADIERRREVGIRRYGTALQPNNGRNALLDEHSTRYTDRAGCFPLCEHCWQQLATPEAREPFYEVLMNRWDADAQTRDLVFAAVREGL